MKLRVLFRNSVFVINVGIALTLLVACLVPYIPAEKFPYLSFLGLGVPIMVILNFIFLLYWLLVERRKALLSAVFLMVTYVISTSFVSFNLTSAPILKDDLKIMNFNVRSFNRLGRIKNPMLFQETLDFISQEDPDIICFQEMDYSKRKDFKGYPYYFVKFRGMGIRSILGIYSKFPIIDQGTLDWPDTANNGAYIDVLYKKDTIRVYNLHLESYKYHPKKATISQDMSGRLLNRINSTIQIQAEQARLFNLYNDSISYKTIICADLNNTQYANSYRLIKGDRQDSFLEKGVGLGRTYKSIGLPFRIDFIFADPDFEVRAHKNYNIRLSDHFPVMASFRLKDH
tara:strand:- start:1730 stop:2758 length:1029 start_codon:yes stop_codon:yes gene_type:complete